MSGKSVVILGAGVGGLVAANRLRQLLPREHQIILVEKKPVHAFAPSFLWLMTGERNTEQITREVQRLVRPGIRIIPQEARRLDTVNHRVETTGETLNYDYLIIALGAELAPQLTPGLTDDVHTFYTLKGAQKLHEALRQFRGGKIALVIGKLPYKCPGAPHEGAMLIADFFRKQGLKDKVEILLFTPEAQPMPVAGPELGKALRQMLESKNISFNPSHNLASIDQNSHELSFEGKDPFRYDMLIAIPPHVAPQIVQEAGLTDGSGWIPVDRATLKTNREQVFAIGDITSISIPGRWKSDTPMKLPKAGVFAHVQAEVVAHRIASEIDNSSPTAEFCGLGYCMLEAGEDLAGFAFGDFFAEPTPRLELRRIGSAWHIGKVLFEKWWLSPLGMKRELLRMSLKLGGKTMGIPIEI
jgi:sulfide:quinone oxidoreductase